MRVLKAQILLEDGQVIEVEGGTLLTLAHKMIEDSTPELNTVIPDAKIQEWKTEIERMWVRLPVYMSSREVAVQIGLQLKQEHFFAIERHKHNFNETVLAYSERLKKAEQ